MKLKNIKLFGIAIALFISIFIIQIYANRISSLDPLEKLKVGNRRYAIGKIINVDHFENSVRSIVALQVHNLRSLKPPLTKRIKSDDLHIVEGIYGLDTGKVEILSENFVEEMIN